MPYVFYQLKSTSHIPTVYVFVCCCSMRLETRNCVFFKMNYRCNYMAIKVSYCQRIETSLYIYFIRISIRLRGPGSSVSIATGYGLDGPGIESRCGRVFPHLSRPALGPPSLLYNGHRVFPGGKERPGRDADPSLPSSAVVMKG